MMYNYSLPSMLPLTRYSETLLTKADELITKGEFGLAVVVAHMACEISAELAISQAFAAKGIVYLEDWADEVVSNYNLGHERVRKLYTALTGKQIQQEQSFWKDFKDSVERRNAFVHKGEEVTEADAKASLKAVKAVVEYLK
ncbi:MAG: hypothetical protein ACLPKT_00370 [Methylocella sp.]